MSVVVVQLLIALFLHCLGILYFVSCTVNPILYNLLSRNYRQAFKITLCCFCITDSVRLQRQGYAGTVFYSERTGPAATAGLAVLHCPDGMGLTSNWRRTPTVKNRTQSPDAGDAAAAAADAGVNDTTADVGFMAKANCIHEIIKESALSNGASDGSAKRDRSPCNRRQKIKSGQANGVSG